MSTTNTNKPRKLGPYVIGNFIGQGAFGTVYVAKSEEDNKSYAIKSISKAKIRRDPRLEDYLKLEMSVMHTLNHPNLLH
jgi:serine/threonine protein kinase